ncbi:MAG: hypothetical protein M4579_007243, partial [Chaenotheca gracillima]
MDCMREDFSEGVVLDGRYKTISPLNHGSFGMVFMAKDMHTGELVAIKCLTKASAANACPASLAIDDRSEELACHHRLGSHPNIVNLLHHFESDAHTYLVLEYCSMGDLYEAIRNGRGPLKTDHVREFMLQLVDAIGFIHDKGIFHRDLKPENIFLTHDGNMKLGDFGLATTIPWSNESNVGSDRYMAPEQYDPAGLSYSPAQADIWAIGICLLNILFSRNPFVTPTERDPLFADFVRDRESLFDVFPTMSQDTFEVIIHAMPLDPSKRSLSAVRDALLRVVSFTTDDESLDDEFCTEDREVVPASANREPLRTPSIQSPHVDQGGSFPWAKALQASPPQPIRQLSAIADVSTAAENAQSSSFESDRDEWFSAKGTPSIGSVLENGLPTFKNLKRSDPMPISGSLPAARAMASVFGKKDEMVSKSWSDLWDEDTEEENEAERRRDALRERTPQPATPPRKNLQELRLSQLTQPKAVPVETTDIHNPQSGRSAAFKEVFDGVDENEVFSFEDHAPPRYSPPPRYTPPSRRDIMDKWAALGDRRRAFPLGKSTSPEAITATTPREYPFPSDLKDPPSSSPPNNTTHKLPFPRREVPFPSDVKGARGEVGLGMNVGNTALNSGYHHHHHQPQQKQHHYHATTATTATTGASAGVWDHRQENQRIGAKGRQESQHEPFGPPLFGEHEFLEHEFQPPLMNDDIGDLEWVG